MMEHEHQWQIVKVRPDDDITWCPYWKVVCKVCGMNPVCITLDGRPFQPIR